jgi:hypothetical protein
MAAVAYGRAVRGANDRLRVAIIGPGTQGTGLMKYWDRRREEIVDHG